MQLRLCNVLGNVGKEDHVVNPLYVHGRAWAAGYNCIVSMFAKLCSRFRLYVCTCGQEPQWNVGAELLVLLELTPVDVPTSNGALRKRLARALTRVAVLAHERLPILALAVALARLAIVRLYL